MTQSWWTADGAAVGVYYWGTSSDPAWPGVRMSPVSGQDGTWSYNLPSGVSNIIFVRVNGDGAISDWGAQTEDMTLPTDGKNLFTISNSTNCWSGESCKCSGTWSTYGSSGGGDTPGGGSDPVNPGQDFSTAVPSQCTDVMLQAFYWNSHSDGTYGTSQWPVLLNAASEISQYFQLVWLPPSCDANDDMGYIPKQYSNQNSKMGMRAGLKNLISTLHSGGTRVLADVVINHAGNKSSWNDFMDQDFGTYGKFSPQSSWITSTDEAASNGYQVGPNADDGQESNRNYKDARDWDHTNSQVQAMCKAYLKFLKGEIGYDGYRFDYSVGYHVSHTNDYVSAAKPYISVMEYWVTNAGTLKTRIDQASKNTMTFDFAQRDAAFQNGITKNNYSNLVKPGMRGQDYQKYAVTFVDNHDTFKRPDIGGDCGNKTDGSSINDKELIMQCNAYILSMPGIPCVFWPHWYKYKSDIKAMIEARRSAGIHSESAVSETNGNGYYEATVTGKYGKVILYLGSSASKSAPSGYKQAVKGSKYAMYYTGTMPATEIEQAQIAKPELNKSAAMYNIMGQQVNASYKGVVIQNGNKYLLQ
ncbi:MAG: hypothetical protein IJQ95_00440 [Paludibacteraceae bacterium]|nr:hypothetical protein [Paludibacteraceae bacterium]